MLSVGFGINELTALAASDCSGNLEIFYNVDHTRKITVFLLPEVGMPLKVAIVGGGIAGITAAAALTRSGHEVEV